MANIEIIYGDILSQAAEALVCPAHKHLVRGRALSAQIYDRAGSGLVEECAGVDECAVGEARLTKAYDLPFDYILHTVTPQWSSGDQWGTTAVGQLRACYRSVLELALAQQIATLVFPALGAGTNRFPHSIAAHLALDELNGYGDRFDCLTVCLHRRHYHREWLNVAQRFYPRLLEGNA